MPVALAGVDLAAVAVFMLLFALLFALRYTIVPLVHALHGALGWVPFLGDLVQHVDHAIVEAIDGAMHSVAGAIVTLWHGAVWAFDETILGLEYFTQATVDAFRFAHNTVIPDIVHAVVDPTIATVSALDARADAIERDLHTGLAKAEHVAVTSAAAALSTAERDIADLGRGIEADIAERLDRLHAEIDKGINDAVGVAERQGAQAIDALRTAEQAAINQAEGVGALALDEIHKLAGGLDLTTIAGLLAAIPLLNTLVQTLATETGLSNAECRAKVKQVCSTDPQRWSRLLGLMGLSLVWPGLIEFVRFLEPMTKDALDGVVELARR